MIDTANSPNVQVLSSLDCKLHKIMNHICMIHPRIVNIYHVWHHRVCRQNKQKLSQFKINQVILKKKIWTGRRTGTLLKIIQGIDKHLKFYSKLVIIEQIKITWEI